MTSYHQPADAEGEEGEPTSPHGKQFVKFTFYRVRDELRAASEHERVEAGRCLREFLERSGEQMLTRTYSTVGTRRDTDFMVWQVADELDIVTDWHSKLLASPLAAVLERPHTFLSMTMRSIYENPLHQQQPGAPGRE